MFLWELLPQKEAPWKWSLSFFLKRRREPIPRPFLPKECSSLRLAIHFIPLPLGYTDNLELECRYVKKQFLFTFFKSTGNACFILLQHDHVAEKPHIVKLTLQHYLLHFQSGRGKPWVMFVIPKEFFNSNLFLWLSVQFATTATNYKLIDRNSKEKNKRPDMMRKSWTARRSKLKCRPPTPEKPGAENCAAFLRPPQLFLGLRVLIAHRPLFLPTTASFSWSNWYIVSDLQQENAQSWRKCT